MIKKLLLVAATNKRLERIVSRPLQRVGLSATQRPLDEVAYYTAQWRDYLATGGQKWMLATEVVDVHGADVNRQRAERLDRVDDEDFPVLAAERADRRDVVPLAGRELDV